MTPAKRSLGRWWNDRRVATKGYIVLAIPVSCLIVVTSLSLALSTQINSLRATTGQVSRAVQHLGITVQRLVDAQDGIRGYAATDDPVFLHRYRNLRRLLEPSVASTPRQDLLSPRQATEVNRQGQAAMSTLGTIARQERQGALTAHSRDTLLRQEKSLVDQVRSELTGVRGVLHGRLAGERQQLAQTESLDQAVDIAGVVVGVLGGLVATYLFVSGVARRLAKVSVNAERLGQDLPLEDAEVAQDEIGVVQGELSRASGRLFRREDDLRRARDQAVAATRAKDEFISRISHELRTPLTAVLGFGELLQYEDLSTENRDSVDRIVRAGRHLLNLINDLLDIGRIETGYLSLTFQPVVLADEVHEVVAILGPMAEEQRVQVTAELGDLAALADRQRLQQVLLNLVSNAIKYNREGGQVVVTGSERPGDLVRLEVRDTGVGIPTEARDRLFVPFERLGAEGSGVPGTGVGLALSKALTEAMHGIIGVESTQGQGSTFWIELPGASSARGGSPGPPATSEAPVQEGQWSPST